MSAPRMSWKPPPKATPCTAAITGTGISRHTRTAYCARLETPWVRFSRRPPPSAGELPSDEPLAILPKLPMSSPAQKARPSPEITTQRTSGFAASASPVSMRAVNIASSSAFILSERVRRTSATPLSMETEMRSLMACPPGHLVKGTGSIIAAGPPVVLVIAACRSYASKRSMITAGAMPPAAHMVTRP